MMPAIKKTFDLMSDDIVDLSTENNFLRNKIGSYDEKWLEESETKLFKQIDDEKKAILIMSRMKKQMNKQYYMAYISYNKLWESEFDNIVSKKDKLKDFNFNQLKFQVHDSSKKDQKLIANFEFVNDGDVINKVYPDEKSKKIRSSFKYTRRLQ